MNLRTSANIAFIPTVLGVFFFAIALGTGLSSGLVLGVVCALAFVLCVGTLIYTDVVFPKSALVTNVSWLASDVIGVERIKDSTASVGAPAPSVLLRALQGKNALRMRVPMDSGPKLRTLVLRPAPQEIERLEALLTSRP